MNTVYIICNRSPGDLQYFIYQVSEREESFIYHGLPGLVMGFNTTFTFTSISYPSKVYSVSVVSSVSFFIIYCLLDLIPRILTLTGNGNLTLVLLTWFTYPSGVRDSTLPSVISNSLNTGTTHTIPCSYDLPFNSIL